MKRAIALATLALAAGGCVTTSIATERGELIRQVLKSTVQLRSERDGGARRAASGVIMATDPGRRRAWILTTRHFLDPPHAQKVLVRIPGSERIVVGTVAFVSPDLDVAIVEADGLDVRPIRMKTVAHLADDILVIAFPWGQRFTVVKGVVSQVAGAGEALIAGAPRMIDVSVSYGSSGGGVFDARSGELLGIVEGYRTVKVAIPEMKDRPLALPVAGETTLIPAAAIRRFLEDSGLTDFLPK